MQTPWKVIAAFLGVFIAGSIFGGFFALRVDRERGGRPAKRVELQQTSAPLNLRLMRRFAEQLDLTPEQKETLKPLMERAGEDIRRVQQSQVREMSIMVERLQQDIAKSLTPEQKLKLEQMQNEMRERMKAARERSDKEKAESRRGDFPAGAGEGSRGRIRNDLRDDVLPPPTPTPAR